MLLTHSGKGLLEYFESLSSIIFSNNFKKVCKKLCDENKSILDTLESIEPNNNES